MGVRRLIGCGQVVLSGPARARLRSTSDTSPARDSQPRADATFGRTSSAHDCRKRGQVGRKSVAAAQLSASRRRCSRASSARRSASIEVMVCVPPYGGDAVSGGWCGRWRPKCSWVCRAPPSHDARCGPELYLPPPRTPPCGHRSWRRRAHRQNSPLAPVARCSVVRLQRWASPSLWHRGYPRPAPGFRLPLSAFTGCQGGRLGRKLLTPPPGRGGG